MVLRSTLLPPASPEVRHNYNANVGDVGLYVLGTNLVSGSVIMPALLVALGASSFAIAFLPALMSIGMALPQIIGAYVVDGRDRMKPFGVFYGLLQRLPWGIIACALPFLALSGGGLMSGALLALLFVSALMSGYSYPAYSVLIAKAIPHSIRGRYQATIRIVGNVAGLAGGALVTLVMNHPRIVFPYNYAILFALAFAVLMLSYVCFLQNRETATPSVPQYMAFKPYVASLFAILRTDRDFVLFLVAQILASATTLGAAFATVYAMKKFSLSAGVASTFVPLMTGTAIVTSLFLGRLADRVGHKVIIAFGTAASATMFLLLLFGPWAWIVYPAFVLFAIAQSASGISAPAMLMTLGRIRALPQYQAVLSIFSAPFLILFSWLGGFLVGHVAHGFQWCFGLSAVFACGSFLVVQAMRHDGRVVRGEKV